MLARCIVTVALALAATTAVANAQVTRTVYRATPTVDAGDGATEVERYGGEVLLADVAGLSLMFLGGVNESEGIMQAGLLVAWLAPPAVHIGHSNGGGAVVSPRRRLVLRSDTVTLLLESTRKMVTRSSSGCVAPPIVNDPSCEPIE